MELFTEASFIVASNGSFGINTDIFETNLVNQLIILAGVSENLADELYQDVKKEDRKISMATVYNTLKQFTNLGIIREVVVDQNKSLYCTNRKNHYHLYIEDEGKIMDIPLKNIDLNIPSIPACLQLHNIDVIVRIRTLKDKKN